MAAMLALPARGFAMQLAAAPPGTSQLPPTLRDVRVDQKLNQAIPLDLTFRDETGATVPLRKYFGQRPVILALVYYNCPMLCGELLRGLTGSLETISFTTGKEFDVLAVSFDPSDTPATAAAQKAQLVKRYRRQGSESGWHFLVGDQASITALTSAVGFHYAYDTRQKQFAHGAAIAVLTPAGVISQYFYGIEFAPRDLRLSLVEASHNRIGNVIDEILLYCYHYDPRLAKYGAMTVNMLRIGAVVTMALLFGFIGLMFWRDSRKHAVGYR